MKWRQIAIGLILISGSVGVVIASHRQRPAKATIQTLKLSTFRYHCQGDPGSLPCLQQHYQDVTQAKGVAAAFAELKAAYNSDPVAKDECHQLAHVIGRTEADSGKNLDQVFAEGDQFCWAGYFHGAMETIAARLGRQQLQIELTSICNPIKDQRAYSFAHYNCVHGLGHGIMAVNANDLFSSLKECDIFTDQWEDSSCQGGVFMQNVMAGLDPDNHTDYLKADQPMYPCTAVDTRYKEQCYLMQTSQALKLVNYDFKTVFKECSAVEVEFRSTCFQSLGRDASGSSQSDAAQTKTTCMMGPTLEAQKNCVIGAVKDFISYYHSDVQAGAFCAALNNPLATLCQETKVSYYQTF